MKPTAVILGAILILIGAARGQQQPVNTGHALDANPLVGSGGRNDGGGDGGRSTFQPANGFSSNYYITGQVTGLAGFHGPIPYRPSDQFQLSLPSAALDDFNRRSVGVQDVLRGETFKTQPYLLPNQTVLKLPGIMSGQNIPGSNLPRLGAVPVQPTEVRSYKDLSPPYLVAPTPLSMTPQLPMDLPLAAPRAAPAPAPTTQPAVVVRQHPGAWRLPEAEVAPVSAGIPDFLTPVDTQVRTEVKAAPVGQPVNTVLPTQDALADLLTAIKQNETAAVPATEPPAGFNMPMPTTAPATSQPAGGVSLENGRVVIHQLAGRRPDPFNAYMGRGTDFLQSGKYYEAARQFTMAVDLDRRQPLARLGRGLSYFAAGEPAIAATDFYRALQLLPSLMETRLDIPAMMDREVFAKRLSELDKQLHETPEDNPTLLFMASYLHTSFGNRAQAETYARWLEKALQGSKNPDPVLTSYVRFALTGRLTPATAPAAQP